MIRFGNGRLRMVAALVGLMLLAPALSAAPLEAQTTSGESKLSEAPGDPQKILDDLVSAHRNYERSRRLYAPSRWYGSGGGACDEVIGRMCLRTGSARDWWFPEDPPERMREELDEFVEQLRAGAVALPEDPWILGNLIFYLGEAGRWYEAGEWLDPCPPVPTEWCQLLRGTVGHAMGEYERAETAFRAALAEMEPEKRVAWLTPDDVAGDDLRHHLDTLPSQERVETAERWWRLSDPAFLVRGNDRWTEHLSRRTVNELRDGGPSAYRLRFGRDLAEITLRYGWEVGWERVPAPIGSLQIDSDIIGHQHPYALQHVAPDQAILQLASTDWKDWNPQSNRVQRTGYAPAYAPNLLPAGEILRFPRGSETVLVGRIEMPPDTSWHAEHAHPPLWVLDPFRGRGRVSGLFVVDSDGRVAASDSIQYPIVLGLPPDEASEVLPERGAMAVHLSAGDWMVSLEHWSPGELRAARTRRGISITASPTDLLTLSDLAVLSPGPDPERLTAALPRMQAAEVRAGGEVLVGWELFGLGAGSPEALSYRLVLTREAGGLLQRAVGWLGLGSDDPKAELAWSEEGPAVSGPAFRSIALAIPPELEPGDYLLRLALDTVGRETLTAERTIRVTIR